MDLRYRPDQISLRDRVREFAQTRILPHARQWSEAAEFPASFVAELGAAGLTGLAIPKDLGGAGHDMLSIALISEELAAADGAMALTLAAHNSLCAGHVLAAANADQKKRWLPALAAGEHLGAWALTEPNAGSDANGVQTVAQRDGDSYVLNGRKHFITNGTLAGFSVILARTGERQLSAFGIPRGNPGLRPGKLTEKMGLHASDTAEVILADCRVPVEDRIGVEGEAFEVVKKVLDRGRIGIGAIAIGLGRAALELAIKHAKERHQFGRPLAEFQMTKLKVARAGTELDAARLLVHRAAALADKGEPFTAAAAMAKLYASETGTRVANHALQILGGYGYLREYDVERIARDARLMEIGEGTSEIQRIVIARSLLRAS